MSRAAWLASFHLQSGALRTRLFPPSKWAGLFPSAAYRRSAPPQLALGRLKWRRLGCLGEAWMASQRKRPPEFQNYIGLLCEPRGLLPSDGLYTPINRKSHQTREPWRLSCHGGNIAAKLFSHEYPRARRARCGVKGHCPLRKPRDLPSSGGLYQPAGRKSHQTREPRGLSPSGGKTPANPHVPLRPCAP